MLKNFLMSACLLSIGLSAVAMDETPSLDDKAARVLQHREYPKQYFQKETDQEDPSAQINLGILAYNEGNLEDAKFYLEQVISKKEDAPLVMRILGDIYYNKGVFENTKNYWKIAADQGDTTAQINLGIRLYNEHNLEDAKFYLEQVISKKEDTPQVMRILGDIYYNKGEFENAKNYWEIAADQGDISAQRNLGCRYKEGQGDTKNLEEAFRLFKLAADQGDSFSQNELGYMYQNGLGVPKDTQEARRLLKLAADQGSGLAKRNLGIILFNEGNLEDAKVYLEQVVNQGEDTPQVMRILGDIYHKEGDIYHKEGDIENAKNYWKIAAYQGDTTAQINLGIRLFIDGNLEDAKFYLEQAVSQGKDTPEVMCILGVIYYKKGDFENATNFWKIAADQGDLDAHYNLGDMYQSGLNIEKNLEKSFNYWIVAASTGHQEAKEKLKEIRNLLSYKEPHKIKEKDKKNDPGVVLKGLDEKKAKEHFTQFESQFTNKFKSKHKFSNAEIEDAAKELFLAAELGNPRAKKELQDFKKSKGYKDAQNGKADTKSTNTEYRLSVKLHELDYPDAPKNKQAILKGKSNSKPSVQKGSSQKSTPMITSSPSKKNTSKAPETKPSANKTEETKAVITTTPQSLSSEKNDSTTNTNTNTNPDISRKTLTSSRRTTKQNTTSTTSTTTTMTTTTVPKNGQTAIERKKDLTTDQQPSQSHEEARILPNLLADTPSVSGEFSEANSLSERQLRIEEPSQHSGFLFPSDEKNVDLKDSNGKEKTSKTLSHKKQMLKIPLTRRNSETQLTSTPKASENDSGLSLKRQEPRRGLIRTQSLTNVLLVKDNQKTGNKEEQSYEKGKSQHHSNKKGFFNHLTSWKDKDKSFEKMPSKIREKIVTVTKDDSSPKSKGEGSKSRKSSASSESQDSPGKISKKLRRTSSRSLLSCSDESSIENEISENSLIRLNILPEKAENYYPRHDKKLHCILNQKFGLNSEDQKTLWVILIGDEVPFKITLNDIEKLFSKFIGFTRNIKQGGNHKVIRGMGLTLNPNADSLKEGAYWGQIEQAKEKIINIIAKTLTIEDDVDPQEDKSSPCQPPLVSKFDAFTKEKK